MNPQNAEYVKLAAPIIDAIKDQYTKATDQKDKDNLNAAMRYLDEHNDPKDLPSLKNQRNIFFAIENEVGLATVPMMGSKLGEAYKNNPKAHVFFYARLAQMMAHHGQDATLNQSGGPPNNQSGPPPKNQSGSVPKNQSGLTPKNQSGSVPKNQSGPPPKNQSGPAPNKQSGPPPKKQAGILTKESHPKPGPTSLTQIQLAASMKADKAKNENAKNQKDGLRFSQKSQYMYCPKHMDLQYTHRIYIEVRMGPIVGGLSTDSIIMVAANDTGSNVQSIRRSDANKLNTNRLTTMRVQIDTADDSKPSDALFMESRVLRRDMILDKDLNLVLDAENQPMVQWIPLTNWYVEAMRIVDDDTTALLTGETMRNYLYFATTPGNEHLLVGQTKQAIIDGLT